MMARLINNLAAIELMSIKRRGRSKQSTDLPLADLYGRPAFMIRRAHQIATSIFTSSWSELDLTPSQFSVLFSLRQCGPTGQNELGRLVALDRSTTALVVRLLRARNLVRTSADSGDRRKVLVDITDEGRLLLARAEKLSSKASEHLLSAFDPKQAHQFLALLERFNSAFGAPEAPSPQPAARRSHRTRASA